MTRSNLKNVVGEFTERINDILGFDTWEIIKGDTLTPSSGEIYRYEYRLIHTDKTKVHTVWSDVIKGYESKERPAEISRWQLVPMIGCCGIIVSTVAYVKLPYRNKGLGTLLNSLRIALAKSYGFSLLLCTDVEQNKNQRSIFKHNKWTDIYSFTNANTGSVVNISVIDL